MAYNHNISFNNSQYSFIKNMTLIEAIIATILVSGAHFVAHKYHGEKESFDAAAVKKAGIAVAIATFLVVFLM